MRQKFRGFRKGPPKHGKHTPLIEQLAEITTVNDVLGIVQQFMRMGEFDQNLLLKNYVQNNYGAVRALYDEAKNNYIEAWKPETSPTEYQARMERVVALIDQYKEFRSVLGDRYLPDPTDETSARLNEMVSALDPEHPLTDYATFFTTHHYIAADNKRSPKGIVAHNIKTFFTDNLKRGVPLSQDLDPDGQQTHRLDVLLEVYELVNLVGAGREKYRTAGESAHIESVEQRSKSALQGPSFEKTVTSEDETRDTYLDAYKGALRVLEPMCTKLQEVIEHSSKQLDANAKPEAAALQAKLQKISTQIPREEELIEKFQNPVKEERRFFGRK